MTEESGKDPREYYPKWKCSFCGVVFTPAFVKPVQYFDEDEWHSHIHRGKLHGCGGGRLGHATFVGLEARVPTRTIQKGESEECENILKAMV